MLDGGTWSVADGGGEGLEIGEKLFVREPWTGRLEIELELHNPPISERGVRAGLRCRGTLARGGAPEFDEYDGPRRGLVPEDTNFAQK